MTDTHPQTQPTEYPSTGNCAFCCQPVLMYATVCSHCTRQLVGPGRGDVRVADVSARRGIGILLFIALIQLVVLLAILLPR